MILIVDDKAENNYSLRKTLESNRFEVDTASSGEEALKKVLKNSYDLIILDVQMPGMDGYEVAETISGYSKTVDTPILFLSAVNKDKKFIAKGYASGALDYITKPVDPDILLLKVHNFCRLSRQTRELNTAQQTLRAEIESRIQAQEALHQQAQLLEHRVAERTRELVQANKELEISNNDLQQFASVASHDLKEPLRKIQIFSSIIRERVAGSTDESVPDYIARIASSAMRMERLINDLLSFSRLSVANISEPTDLNEIISEILVDLEIQIREKNAVIDVGPIPPLHVVPGQMRQVFQNLISNAIKFSKEGIDPHVQVKAARVSIQTAESPEDPEGGFCRIIVSDNGIGFNEKYLDKIFTIFQRLNVRDKYEGNGIGLAITKKIIDKHGGTITAQSREGEGATFIIFLPVKHMAAENGVETNPENI